MVGTALARRDRRILAASASLTHTRRGFAVYPHERRSSRAIQIRICAGAVLRELLVSQSSLRREILMGDYRNKDEVTLFIYGHEKKTAARLREIGPAETRAHPTPNNPQSMVFTRNTFLRPIRVIIAVRDLPMWAF